MSRIKPARNLQHLPDGDQPFDPARSFYAKEKTYAGYVQGKYDIEISGPIALDGLVGVRVTKTDRDISGTGTVASTRPRVRRRWSPSARSTSDTDVLPNASARLKVGGGLQFRASYAKVLSRPDFGSLNPGGSATRYRPTQTSRMADRRATPI